ncbi:DUF397 domain-containing protein [Actinomadura algeriensis]|uniref:DUF397 domain-containing protein n=1 Tax=Actinomadura algeriensis TaxID=1679523 RepID=UPI001789E8E2
MDLKNALWRKSSRSTNNGGHCVELASAAAGVAVRDSKDPGLACSSTAGRSRG